MQTAQQVTKQQQARIVARMQQRIAVVQALRASKHAARIAAKQQAAFIAAVQQQAAQYGVAPAQVQAMLHAVNKGAPAARANSATQQPSSAVIVVNGVPLKPCKAVHAICAANPTATRAQVLHLCKLQGINQATASTQYGVYQKTNKVAA